MPPKYRILYVNNEIPLPEPGKRFLEKDGQFSVESSTSAPAALSLLGSKDYDAIVSGYRMPEMDGIEFLKKVTIFGKPHPVYYFHRTGTGRGRYGGHQQRGGFLSPERRVFRNAVF